MELIDWNDMPVAVEPLETRSAGDEVLVHDVNRGKIHVLNRTAAQVLESCDGRTTAAYIVDTLCAQTGAAREIVEADIAKLLEQFRALSLIR